jgi:hypothetical protein
MAGPLANAGGLAYNRGRTLEGEGMSILRKVRVLVGAWLHQPFSPRPEKVSLDEESGREPGQEGQRDPASLEGEDAQLPDSGRVADLIAQQRDEAGSP